MAIQNTLLGTSPTAISPIQTSDSAITVVMFCNLNTTTENIDVHAVKQGDAPDDVNKIVNQAPIGPSDTFIFSSERLVLGAGDRLYALTTTADQVSVTLSYVVI